MTAPAYTALSPTYTPTTAERLGVLQSLAACGSLAGTSVLESIDPAGVNSPVDLTPYVIKDGSAPPTVFHECTAEVTGRINFTMSIPLQWGSAQVRAWLALSSPEYQGGTWQLFQVGIYVCTTPGSDNLDAAVDRYVVTGYDQAYLLQAEPNDSFSWAAGAAQGYAVAVRDVMRASGVLGASAFLNTLVSYPADWQVKTMPVAMSYPLGSGRSYLQIINELLDASGCLPIYLDQFGAWHIDLVAPPATQPLEFTLDGSSAATLSIVKWAAQSYNGDVYNVPNRYIFIQQGLTFQPTGTDGSNGQYVVDVLDGPAGQVAQGRILPKTVMLDSSGQADLKTKGDKYITDSTSGAETIQLGITPWPAIWQSNVFKYIHPQLPLSSSRRVQVKGWTLPLDGGAMTVNANVVGMT